MASKPIPLVIPSKMGWMPLMARLISLFLGTHFIVKIKVPIIPCLTILMWSGGEGNSKT